jgi:hypothetical protein
MQVSVFSMFNGLTIDGVDVMNVLADIDMHFQVVRESISAVPAAFSEGLTIDAPEHVLRFAGEAGRVVAKGAFVARCVVVGAQVSWRLAAAHWAEYGAEYRSVAQFLAALWFLQARNALGDVPAEEFETLGECAELPTVKARVQGAAAMVKGWVWAQLVRGYEAWLAMVSKEVTEILGYAPEWVRKAVLIGE